MRSVEKRFGASAMPGLDTPVGEPIGDHNRAGKPDMAASDWAQFLNFAEANLQR